MGALVDSCRHRPVGAKASGRGCLDGIAAALLAAGLAGCGGGAATLHPAHALPAGAVTVGAGVSGQFAFGDLDGEIEQGRSAAAGGAVPAGSAEQELVEGAITQAMVAPGVAPWVGARVGLGADNEAGLTYLGRTVRADGRHAFQNESWALSVGAGASVILLRAGAQGPPETDPAQTGGSAGSLVGGVDDLSATGWGVDVPVIAGWRSTGQVLQIWAGARGGLERIDGEMPLDPDTSVPLGDAGSEASAPVDGRRWFAGGLFGLSVGMRPVWVAIQLDAAYVSVSGSVDFPGRNGTAMPGVAPAGDPPRREAEAAGLTLAPAGAIIGRF